MSAQKEIDTLLTQTFKFNMEFITNLKLFHFQTPKYSDHKSADTLYESMQTNFDILMETMQGKYGRIPKTDLTINVSTIVNFDIVVIDYLQYIETVEKFLNEDPIQTSDILTILGNIKIDCNKFLYLYTFK